MEMSKLTIVPMLQKHASEIAKWKYEGIYSFYNRTNEITSIDDAEIPIANSFVAYDNDGILVGHFHFGPDGQIPTIENYEYNLNYLDIGLGLRPDLCNQGFGVHFVTLGIKFANTKYNATKFRLSVAAFNERAIKVYERIGFNKVCKVTNSYFKNKFYIMTRE